MTNEALATLSDTLLSLCERDREAPHYKEATFRQKLQLARVREAQMPLPRPRTPTDWLARREWREVVAHAGLTPAQSEVFARRIDGWTFEEIGAARGHSRQGALNIFSQAIKKIRAACTVYPYAGLSSVYRAEVSRGVRSGSSRYY